MAMPPLTKTSAADVFADKFYAVGVSGLDAMREYTTLQNSRG